MIPTGNLTFNLIKESDLIFVQAWLQKHESDLVDSIESSYDVDQKQLILKGSYLDLEFFPLLAGLSRDLRGVEVVVEHHTIASGSVICAYKDGELIRKDILD